MDGHDRAPDAGRAPGGGPPCPRTGAESRSTAARARTAAVPREHGAHEPPHPEGAVLAADRRVHPGDHRHGGARGPAARLGDRRRGGRRGLDRGGRPALLPVRGAPLHPRDARRAEALAPPPHRPGLHLRGVPAARAGEPGPRPLSADPTAPGGLPLPVPGALHHPVLDRLHLDRPGQRPRRDLRGILLQPRRDPADPAARGPAARRRRGRVLGRLPGADRPPATGAVPRRPTAAPPAGRLPRPPPHPAGLCRPGLDPARRVHRVQRGYGRRCLAPGHPAPARRAPRRRGGAAGADAPGELVRAEADGLRTGGPDGHPVRRVQEEPGRRAAHGERPVRRAREPRRAAVDALPPDAADGLRGHREAALPGAPAGGTGERDEGGGGRGAPRAGPCGGARRSYRRRAGRSFRRRVRRSAAEGR
ncbi:hypothetical protein GA0115249_107178 [Streptomyces sp. PpalLS-921]|nr:hypothetical protein GA0115249_107178 [Streptomyces sp. PpalLS-921]